MLLLRSGLLAMVAASASCGGHRGTTDLNTLVRRDSTYLAPETMKPFSGNVVRYFPDDAGHVQLEGTLKNGLWEGEMTVYHESGRVRYQGRLSRGAPCGTWLENRDDEASGSVYDELKRDIASMGVYPDCPDG